MTGRTRESRLRVTVCPLILVFDIRDAAGLRLTPTLHGWGSIRIAFPDFEDLGVLVHAFEFDLDGPGGREAVGFERSG